MHLVQTGREVVVMGTEGGREKDRMVPLQRGCCSVWLSKVEGPRSREVAHLVSQGGRVCGLSRTL